MIEGIPCITLVLIVCFILLCKADCGNMHDIPFISVHPKQSKKLRSHLAHIEDELRDELITLMKFLDQQSTQLRQLSEQYPQLNATHEDIINTYDNVPVHWEHNGELLRRLLAPFSFRYCLMPPADSCEASDGIQFLLPNNTNIANHASYESVAQLLLHLMRDYSKRAEETRRTLYTPILSYLMSHFPPFIDADTSNHGIPRRNILLPGAGMGRLALEIAAHTPTDVHVEANECSFTMITAMQNLFNRLLLPGTEPMVVYPNLQGTGMDEHDHHDRLKNYTIPDPQAKQLVATNNVRRKISVEFGDFMSVYGNPSRGMSYHAVITCFFIDTATNIVDYIGIIGRLLSKHHGIWINAGPLHYHSRSAVRYTLEGMNNVIANSGFTLLEQTKVTTSYCGEDEISLKPEVYHVPVQVWKLTDPTKVLSLYRKS